MFWNKKIKEPKEPKKDLTQECYEDIKSFRDIGETFMYLGVEMTVIGHWEYIGVNILPCIQVNYVDKNGKIQPSSFLRNQLPLLRKLNP